MINGYENFTKKYLQDLPPPADRKSATYKDSLIRGLILIVHASEMKSFYLYKKINGNPERILIGTFPDLSVENARKAAIGHLNNIANGKNPQEDKRKIKSELIFEQHFNSYMERYSKVHKKSWLYDEREVKKFLPHWLPRKLSSIKKTEVQLLLEKIYQENGLYQSNRMLERIRAIFNKAIEWGWKGINPVKQTFA